MHILKMYTLREFWQKLHVCQNGKHIWLLCKVCAIMAPLLNCFDGGNSHGLAIKINVPTVI